MPTRSQLLELASETRNLWIGQMPHHGEGWRARVWVGASGHLYVLPMPSLEVWLLSGALLFITACFAYLTLGFGWQGMPWGAWGVLAFLYLPLAMRIWQRPLLLKIKTRVPLDREQVQDIRPRPRIARAVLIGMDETLQVIALRDRRRDVCIYASQNVESVNTAYKALSRKCPTTVLSDEWEQVPVLLQ